ncbi:MAG: hypothetical protein ACFFEN_03615 [Candidatus Thorarchaeota archaeon]
MLFGSDSITLLTLPIEIDKSLTFHSTLVEIKQDLLHNNVPRLLSI